MGEAETLVQKQKYLIIEQPIEACTMEWFYHFFSYIFISH